MMRRGQRSLICLLLAMVLLVGGGMPGLHTQMAEAEESVGTVYYIDALGGDDAHPGTSEGAAWKSLNKVNATTFMPGDTIRFKAGGVWKGTLHPKGSGAEGSPIAIDRYGEGPKPLIAGDGAAAAVYFYSQEYWEVRNLEITNYAATAGERRGIHVAGHSGGWNNPKVYRHFVFEYLDIHSVKGSLAMDYAHNGGIIIWDPTWNYVVTDVTIQHNKIYSLDSVGIYLNGGSKPYSFNNKVADNVIYDIGGDGAFVLNTTHGLIERNVVYDTHKRTSGYHVPLWFFESKDSIIQYNEVFNTYPGGDAMAYDSDYKSDGTIIQYNYSHNNAGGMSLAVNDGTQTGTFNRGTIIRYNISQSDLGAVFNFSGTPEDTQIYNNTVYIPPNSTTKVVDTLYWGGWAKNQTYTNNLIVNLGTGGYNFGSSTGNVFDNNLFYGNHPQSVLNLDSNKVVADPMLAAPGTGRIGRDTLAGYQLLEGSPAIGAGKLIANNGGLDFFGNPVSAEGQPNIGAYEGPGIPAGTVPPGAEIVNLLVNPGFEDGFAGWGNTYGGAAVVDTDVRTGDHAARLTNAVSGIEQTIALKPNTIYKLSGYAASMNNGRVLLGVKNHGQPAKDVAFGTGSTYAGREVVFTTGPVATNAVIYIYKQDAAGSVTVDDLLLYEYGEIEPPATPPEVAPEPLPGKQNLARTAALTASSYNPLYPPSLATDGSKIIASRWITAAGSQAPHWLELAWEESYAIDRVRVWSGAGEGTSNWQMRDFQVQYWEDGEWKLAAEVTNNPMDVRLGQYNDLSFPVVNTDKIRLYITNGTVSPQINDNHARLVELEVWEHDPNPVEPEITPVYVHAIQLTPENRITKLDVGQSVAIQAQVLPTHADDPSLAWRVEGQDGLATSLASITPQGVLTALAAGTVAVVAEANDGSGVSERTWIDITEPPALPNVASLATVTASSSHESGSFPPTYAINGNRHTAADRWVSGAEGPHWLELAWDQPYEVEGARLWSGQSDAKGMQLADFELQAWDGSGWVTVASVTGNEEDNYFGQFAELAWEPVTTERLRLYVTKGNASADGRVRLFELEVYGDEPGDNGSEPEPTALPIPAVSGPASAYAGQSATFEVSAAAGTTAYNTFNAVVAYDPAALTFATETGSDGMTMLAEEAISVSRPGVAVLGAAVKTEAGLINVLLGAPGQALEEEGEWFSLHGQVLEQPTPGETTLRLDKAEIIDSDGEVQTLAVGAATHVMTISLADLAALGAAIVEAQTLHDSTSTGSGAGQVSTAAKAALHSAIQSAQAVYADGEADQTAVNAALSALGTAVQTFRSNIIQPQPIDTAALQAAIDTAQAAHDAAPTGDKVGQYPQAAKTSLMTAITAAESVRTGNPSQSAVNAAVTELNDKLAVFRQQRVTLVAGESQITLRTLSIVSRYYGLTAAAPNWSEIAAADVLDQQEITIQSLAAIARMVLSDWYYE